jgi:hypothetical protein
MFIIKNIRLIEIESFLIKKITYKKKQGNP